MEKTMRAKLTTDENIKYLFEISETNKVTMYKIKF